MDSLVLCQSLILWVQGVAGAKRSVPQFAVIFGALWHAALSHRHPLVLPQNSTLTPSLAHITTATILLRWRGKLMDDLSIPTWTAGI